MTTDRTQPARPAALNDRSSAAAAVRRDGSAFAALLDAHAPAPRREEARRDGRAPQAHDAAARRDERAPQPHDAGARHDRPAAPSHELSRDAARHDLLAAAPQLLALAPVPEGDTAGQPVAVPPFVATVPAEAPAQPAPAAPAPLFMLAPEAVAIVPAATPQPAAEAPAVVTPQPAAAAPAVANQPPLPGDVASQPHEPAPAPATPQPHEAASAPTAPQPVAPEGDQPAVAEAPEPHAAAPGRAAVAAEPAPAAAPAAQAPASEPVAQTPVSAPLSAPVAGRVATDSVPLYRAPAAVSTLLHVAVERGITRAKMALRPAELGGIEIRLQATAGGVAAQVVADSPEAARLLAQAGDDLRRALEAREVTLISLEVSTSSEQRQHHRARGEWGDDTPTVPGRAAGAAEGDAEPGGRDPITQTVIELPGGLLVDVLA